MLTKSAVLFYTNTLKKKYSGYEVISLQSVYNALELKIFYYNNNVYYKSEKQNRHQHAPCKQTDIRITLERSVLPVCKSVVHLFRHLSVTLSHFMSLSASAGDACGPWNILDWKV